MNEAGGVDGVLKETAVRLKSPVVIAPAPSGLTDFMTILPATVGIPELSLVESLLEFESEVAVEMELELELEMDEVAASVVASVGLTVLLPQPTMASAPLIDSTASAQSLDVFVRIVTPW